MRCLGELRAVARGPGLAVKFERRRDDPFHRLKVRVRRGSSRSESTGWPPFPAPPAASIRRRGTRFWPIRALWWSTRAMPTRSALGSFRNAIDPQTKRFRRFSGLAVAPASTRLAGRRLALFCTGGIRCERRPPTPPRSGLPKSPARRRHSRYLAETAERDSLWQGECFVFDERVSVVHAWRRARLRSAAAANGR